MDLVILLVLTVLVIYVYKKFSSFVYFIVIVDIMLRLINFLKDNIASPELYNFLNSNMPTSIVSIIDKYLTGLLNEVFIWFYVVIFIIFEYYTIKIFFKKR
ncbi:MAG: hypothetical protein PHE54_02275 [Bacilli bacterium]|nr:hypothetical protein [Bacilli bacterium]